jgi:hypothetical protein
MRTLTLASALLIAGLATAQSDQLGKMGAQLVEKHASSICTINVVMKLEFMGQSREQRINGRGIIAHESGLILTGVEVAAPNFNVQARGQNIDVKVTPVDFKVVFNNEEEEREAFLVGKDSKLGFAFVQLKDGLPEEMKSQVIDYGAAKKPEVGDQLLSVYRLGKGYDYAPFFSANRVVGQLKKPRRGWMMDGSARTGLPVWNLQGELVGCQARIESGLGSGRPGSGQSVVLRGGQVAAAVKQAVKQAEELAAEKAAEKEEGTGEETPKKDGEGDKKESDKQESGEGK